MLWERINKEMIARNHSGPTGVLIHRLFARYQENAAIIIDSEKIISVMILDVEN